MAAVGGLLLGLGLGLSIGRRASVGPSTDRGEIDARVRTVVLPVLERRASELGIRTTPRLDAHRDVIATAVTLASEILRSDATHEFAHSETVEFSSTHASKTVSQRPPSAS